MTAFCCSFCMFLLFWPTFLDDYRYITYGLYLTTFLINKKRILNLNIKQNLIPIYFIFLLYTNISFQFISVFSQQVLERFLIYIYFCIFFFPLISKNYVKKHVIFFCIWWLVRKNYVPVLISFFRDLIEFAGCNGYY